MRFFFKNHGMVMCFKSYVLPYRLTIILLEGINTFFSDYRHSDQLLFLKKNFFFVI